MSNGHCLNTVWSLCVFCVEQLFSFTHHSHSFHSLWMVTMWNVHCVNTVCLCVFSVCGSTMFRSHTIHTVFIVWEWSQCEMVTVWTQCDLCVFSVWSNYVQITHHSHSCHCLGVVTMWNGHCVNTVWSLCVLYGSTMFKSHIIHTVFIVLEWSQCEMVTVWTQCDLSVFSVWTNYVQIIHHSHSFHSLGVVTMWNGHCEHSVLSVCYLCELLSNHTSFTQFS